MKEKDDLHDGQSRHLRTGVRGEHIALAYLKKQGYRVVALNFVATLGRGLRGQTLTGEIDIIAYDGPTLCFIEVKTRSDETYAPAEAAVDRRKQRQLARTARRYRQLLGVLAEAYRFDVVAVVTGRDPLRQRPELRLTRDYFSDARWGKRAFCWQRVKAPDRVATSLT